MALRTPLVDAQLLVTLGPYTAGLKGGAGKAMLARSPETPLPNTIANLPKTGFGVPMAKWLAEATDERAWVSGPMRAAPGIFWPDVGHEQSLRKWRDANNRLQWEDPDTLPVALACDTMGVKRVYFSEGREGFVVAIVEVSRVSIELVHGLR
ncbi:MAG: hypothetical protein M3461_22140 [Pseudomonadota bacterium]|nr:hypothetical protein [Pseudomonadota bacterium]